MGGTKYPQDVRLPLKNGCKECGHGLGLATVSTIRHRFCCKPCRAFYRSRWWRDWRERWTARVLLRLP